MDYSSVKSEPGLRDRVHEDAHVAGPRPSYKSWKKKYKKMRDAFDRKMLETEDLHMLEQKAIQTARRLAIQNDRLMDMLMDINESPQVPFERRIDMNLEDDDDDEDETDSDNSESTQKPTKSFKKLIQEVPHRSYEEYVERVPELREDLESTDPVSHPTSFITPDELDEYLNELDIRIGLKPKHTLAPSIGTNSASSQPVNFALRNPTSVYNWLRRHAPKTFLQDLEKDKDKDKDDREKDDGRKRKSGVPRKRQSTTSRKDKEREKEVADSMDWDDEMGYEASAAGTLKGKRKRDEDPGYRPKGGSSRPTKKRKSKDLNVPAAAKPPKARKSLA
ncbi:hypothetical protein F4861DRAFT_133953 [Xylaria intraflava]|nr:hypothetical protein F4861DRAFT_133953 [Xylaria intraflava]